jgi:hypothetical protein
MEAPIAHSFVETNTIVKPNLLLEIPAYIYISVIASMCVIAGVIWDIAWHMSIGRDGLFSAPHVVTYVGAAGAGFFSGYQVLKTSFFGTAFEKSKMINFWGIFYGSLGALFCIWGGIASLTSAPFDDWWHNTYGLDVKILSPPHAVLLLGLLSVQMGAMVGVLAFLNNAHSATLNIEQNARRKLRLQWMFAFTAAFFVTSLFIFLTEELGRWRLHNPDFYQLTAAVFPFILIATSRALGMKWGITTIAIIYLLFHWVINAILRLLPAEPLLGPIHNQITTYQTLGFPLLLFLPGIFLDWIIFKFHHKKEWFLAIILGITFVVVMLVVHYPFGSFLHESPLARNWFWGSNSWSFQNDTNFQYRFKFAPWNQSTPAQWVFGLLTAGLISIISTWIGFKWGNWMRNVKR